MHARVGLGDHEESEGSAAAGGGLFGQEWRWNTAEDGEGGGGGLATHRS